MKKDKRIQFKDSKGKPVEFRDMFCHIIKKKQKEQTNNNK